MSEQIRPIQAGDWVSKNDQPGVFWRVIHVTHVGALLQKRTGEMTYWLLRGLMRAVPHDLDAELRQPSTHAAYSAGSGE